MALIGAGATATAGMVDVGVAGVVVDDEVVVTIVVEVLE